jgi:hypothetical protein
VFVCSELLKMNPVAQEHLQDWASRLDFSDPYKVCVCDPSIHPTLLHFTSLRVTVPNYTVSLGRHALYSCVCMCIWRVQLADFAASITSAEGKDLQRVLSTQVHPPHITSVAQCVYSTISFECVTV